jgi:hypothetical protein
MQVGGPNQRYFRPEISSERSQQLLRDADRDAAEIVRSMRFEQNPDAGRDLLSRGWRGQREGFDGIPRGSEVRGPVSSAIMEKAIAGFLYRGAVFKEIGRDMAVSASILVPPAQERSIRLGDPPAPAPAPRKDRSRIIIPPADGTEE